MLKREFLAILEKKLSRMDNTERQDVLCYYDELIEDRIETTGKSEEQVIYELGNLESIARKIMNSESTKSCERSTPEVNSDEEYNKEFVRRTSTMVNEEHSSERKQISNKSTWIIIICVTAIIWVPLAFGAVSTIFGLLCAVAALIFAFFVTGFALGISGIALLVAGATLFSSNTAFAILELGVGLVLLGLAFMLTPLMVKGSINLTKQCVKGIKFICSKIKGLFNKNKEGGVAYEN